MAAFVEANAVATAAVSTKLRCITIAFKRHDFATCHPASESEIKLTLNVYFMNFRLYLAARSRLSTYLFRLKIGPRSGALWRGNKGIRAQMLSQLTTLPSTKRATTLPEHATCTTHSREHTKLYPSSPLRTQSVHLQRHTT